MPEAARIAPGVRTWDGTPSTLPSGMAGLAVRVNSTEERLPGSPGPIVGIDGLPVLAGWGQWFLVVSPGEHLVEVQYVRPRRTAWASVAEGEVAEFAYDADNAALVQSGVLAALAPKNKARPRERGLNLTLTVAILCMAVLGGAGVLLVPPPVTAGMMAVGAVGGAVATQLAWRRHLRRRGIDYWSLAPYESWKRHAE